MMKQHSWMVCLLASLFFVRLSAAQMAATDDFESYTNNPVGQSGGTGDWAGPWMTNSQFDGGAYLNTAGKLSGTKSIALYGNAGTAGTSVRRALPACTNELILVWSMRADINIDKTTTPVNLRRLAFTVRSGNDASHFGNQRLSFFFAAGSTDLQWYDGSNRATNAVLFAINHIYDFNLRMNPTNRAYLFAVSNRNTGATFSYSGAWTTGADGDPVGSVAFLVRGPTGSGQDVFLDNVSFSAPDYVPPPLPQLPIPEGALWRYYKGRSTPPLQGTNQWYRPEFDDSGWGGPAPSGFGYGDGDDATVFSDMYTNYLSVFTRIAFAVTNPTAITRLNLAADYDDGFIAYLNGVEIARRNLPAGPIAHDTAAIAYRDASRDGMNDYSCNCSPEPKEFIEVDPALLVAGTNILAVSGHNSSLGSSDFSLIIELYTNVTLTRGPFLQMPQQGRVSVLWRTAALTDSAVDYGYDLSYNAGTVNDAGSTREHELMLPALTPGATVYYRVRGGGETLAAGEFRAPKDSAQSFRVTVLSDYGSNSTNTLAIVHQAASMNPDLLITAGDNLQQAAAPVGLFDSHWLTPLSALISRAPFMPSIGNHDIRTEQGRRYLEALSLPTNGPPGLEERSYAFNYGNAHFVMIDGNAFDTEFETTYTNRLEMRAKIVTWLTNDLHNATQTWKFVSYHQPPYTSQGPHPDTDGMKTELSPIFERYGVNIAFQGHNHFYERINPINGVFYFTVGSGGFSVHTLTNQREFSAKVIQKYDFLALDLDGPHLVLRSMDQFGNVLDSYDFDQSHPFKIDGLLDSTNWLRAVNGLKLHAAIRGPHLYVASQDAGEGGDHFIYVSDTLSTQRPANWAKSGNVMQWSAFLADENGASNQTAGFYGWFDAEGSLIANPAVARAVTSGLNNNGTNGNGVMEGTLNLPSYLGSFPTQLLFAVASYATPDGGALVPSVQVPPGNNNGDIEASEFLAISTRDLALDLPLVSAGSNLTTEAGMPVAVTGSASSPSGLPLAYTWEVESGWGGTFSEPYQLSTAFTPTNQPPGPTSAVIRLTVNDTRFDVSSIAVVTVTPWMDSDGDGLSDAEEQTGVNNILTPCNPAGHTSNPALADTDGDGANDGEEAIAGTNPNDPASVFQIVYEAGDLNGIVLRWSSVSGRLYSVRVSTNLLTGFDLLQSELGSTPNFNSFTVPVDRAQSFYDIGVKLTNDLNL